MITEEFNEVLNDCDIKYKSKLDEYGESWKEATIDFLDERLRDEIEEWERADNYQDAYKELIDIINVALMTATRVKKRI